MTLTKKQLQVLEYGINNNITEGSIRHIFVEKGYRNEVISGLFNAGYLRQIEYGMYRTSDEGIKEVESIEPVENPFDEPITTGDVFSEINSERKLTDFDELSVIFTKRGDHVKMLKYKLIHKGGVFKKIDWEKSI